MGPKWVAFYHMQSMEFLRIGGPSGRKCDAFLHGAYTWS